MKSSFCLLIFFACITLCFGQVDKRLKGVEKELNEVLDTWKASGFAVAVVENDKVIYSKGFGYRDFENKKPADANTLFAIGSCTKAFTASLLGILEKEEKLSLDDHPSMYVPELSFSDPAIQQGVTIKDLITHRTGLPRHDFAWYFFPTDSKDSLIMKIKHQKPFADLRETWYYNNFMYLTQGVIAERITGKTWEENIQERIFIPLDMNDSRVSSYEAEESNNVAKGYGVKNDQIDYMPYYRISGMSPAGSIYSSANDMAKWVKTWINGGKNGSDELLPAGYVNQAMSSQMVVNSGTPNPKRPDLHFANYGYGWMVSSYKGHYRVEHGGNINGFSASTSFFPTDSVGIVVLVNQNGSTVTGVVRNIIADRMLRVKKTDWNGDLFEEISSQQNAAESSTQEDSKVEGTRPSHVSEQYTGTYSNEGYGSFKLVSKNDSLIAIFKRLNLYLSHYHYDVFTPLEIKENGVDSLDFLGPIKFNFRTSNQGDIDELAIQIEPAISEPIIFKRTPNEIAVSTEQLEKYVGTYALGPMEAKVYLKEEALYLFVPGQPEYELGPIAEHLFTIKILQGYKVEFTIDENGDINGFKSIQPNGTFSAEKKK